MLYSSSLRILLETTDLGQEVMKIFCSNKNETWNDSVVTTWSVGSPDMPMPMLPLGPTEGVDLGDGCSVVSLRTYLLQSVEWGSGDSAE